MWAVVEIAKKQYRVKQGDLIQVQRLEEKSPLTLDKVLLLADGEDVKVGTPYVAGAKVEAEYVEEKKGDKILVYKFRRRKKVRRKTGHRQIYTYLKISQISKA